MAKFLEELEKRFALAEVAVHNQRVARQEADIRFAVCIDVRDTLQELLNIYKSEPQYSIDKNNTTHPKIWKYCIHTLDLKTPLDFIGVDYTPYED